MILGALSELAGPDFDLKTELEKAGIPGLEVRTERISSRGICGTRARVLIFGEEEAPDHRGHAAHRSLSDVLEIINGLNVSGFVKENACGIYSDIAAAEAEVHGSSAGEVHFHEVGMLDAIADIVGACMLIEHLKPGRILSSPVRTGYGTVKCSHGTIPVPAPASEILLRGMPSYAGDAEGEFATPTGIAVLKHFADGFGQRPLMVLEKTGCGAGSRDAGFPDILRVFSGTQEGEPARTSVITCTVDDMTPEDIGSAVQTLMSDGALDVFVSPVLMKKGRPGHLITCICRPGDTDRVARSVLKNTTTIGLRFRGEDRYELVSRFET